MTELKQMFNKGEKGGKFFVYSTYGELCDVAIALKNEGKDVVLYVPDSDYKKIGDGIVNKAENWHEYLGKGYVWIIDGCENAELQEWLRKHGENVCGTNKEMADMENDRQKGQEWFRELGFNQPDSKNFTDFDDAIDFIKENSGIKYILKQNGDAPKSLNHKTKFDSGIDMIYHLEQLKKSWNEEKGEIDFDLMEMVDGMEIAASAFFNGHDWLRNKEGKVVGFTNGEEKKVLDGGLGSTCGETGTTFLGVDETNELFADIMLRKGIAEKLKKENYRGVFDLNGCLTEDKGFVCFEATSRPGVPATSYEFIAGLKSPTSELIEAMAKGLDTPIDIQTGWGMVMVVYAPPFPLDEDVPDTATSMGQKLWILKDKEPIKDFTKEQKDRIHLENFRKNDDGDYVVATKSGYLLTVTGIGDSIEGVRDDIIEFIKDNIFITDFGHRMDIGKRLEEYI